ncbi:hypothetical protein [Gracilibacillus lacisalsi]|uniref:hypothetical protein n=1 Tax=Gracilibacillus lacisalsi TaxID=393087 RepID=UPI000366D78E|nr:hypothetical protein [Gracilibacillus lacisalsi]
MSIKYQGVDEKITRFVLSEVDKVALKKVRLEKLEALSRKLAYQYCQSHKANYHEVQKQTLDTLRRIKCRPEFYLAE